MRKKIIIDFLGWGILLWLFGYVLGIFFFLILPPIFIGWAILPLGTLATIVVLAKKINSNTLHYYAALAIVWTIIAIDLDYICIVQLLHPADGYYKLDVYVYYVLTFVLPVAVGFYKMRRRSKV